MKRMIVIVGKKWISLELLELSGHRPSRSQQRLGRNEENNKSNNEPTEVMSSPRPGLGGGVSAHADGVGFTLIGIAAVLGASVWLNVAGPVGEFIAGIAHGVFGAGALIVPLVLLGCAVCLMLGYMPPPSQRLRFGIGATLLVVPMLGLVHLFAGNPTTSAGRDTAGGIVGAVVATPLAAGFSVYLAIPILALVLFLWCTEADQYYCAPVCGLCHVQVPCRCVGEQRL